MQLTAKQLKDFDELGYLVLPDCFSGEEMEVLRSEAEAIYATDREEVWREKSGEGCYIDQIRMASWAGIRA